MTLMEKFFGPKRPKNFAEFGRNDPCWCGSGKKYKRCHMADDGEARSSQRATAMKNKNQSQAATRGF